MSQARATTDVDASIDAEEDGGDESLTTDDAFTLLNSRRRRYVLHHLKREGEVDLGALSERVAAWEVGEPVRDVDATERKRVYTSLQQHHLPKMDEKGVVDFDERSGTIELTDSAGELDVYLDVVDGKGVPWSRYYLGLAAIHALILVGSTAALPPFTLLSEPAWMAVAVASFAISATVHVYYDSGRRISEARPPVESRSP